MSAQSTPDLAALRALDVVGAVRALNTALAKRILAERNKENADAGHPDEWPAQQEWDDLAHSSHCIFWQAARREAGINAHPDFSFALEAFANALPALLDRIERAERVVGQYDNVLSTVRDHLLLCVGDGDFAAHSQETVDAELVRLRAARAGA